MSYSMACGGTLAAGTPYCQPPASEQTWLEQRSESGCEPGWYSGVGADAPPDATSKAQVVVVGAVVGLAMLATILAMRGRG